MIVTEEEAKTRWCPFAHVNVPRIPVTWNRIGNDRDVNRTTWQGECIASQCMAWRIWDGNAEGQDLGYCGLAGTP